jgi:Domain of unknown function (DUF1911)
MRIKMLFHEKRRQQFLGEAMFRQSRAYLDRAAIELEANLHENADYPDSLARLSISIANDHFASFVLSYTVGDPIARLRGELESVLTKYERAGQYLWTSTNDRNEPVFTFTSLDDYCQLMQLTGLCFLLHRRDLLPRLAALQDGVDAVGKPGDGNGGTDTLYEEFMAYGLGADVRYETDYLCCSKPYEPLFHAITETTPSAALKEIDRFLKRWYKDLSGTAWHDSHKPNESGDQGGYYGYWSFEAGAAVMLMGIEDDSSLHQYLYYPKDLVAWSRAHTALSDAVDKTAIRLRVLGDEQCLKEGFWFTPARANSRQRFKQGEVMPVVGGDYGATIWQWDETQ